MTRRASVPLTNLSANKKTAPCSNPASRGHANTFIQALRKPAARTKRSKAIGLVGKLSGVPKEEICQESPQAVNAARTTQSTGDTSAVPRSFRSTVRPPPFSGCVGFTERKSARQSNLGTFGSPCLPKRGAREPTPPPSNGPPIYDTGLREPDFCGNPKRRRHKTDKEEVVRHPKKAGRLFGRQTSPPGAVYPQTRRLSNFRAAASRLRLCRPLQRPSRQSPHSSFTTRTAPPLKLAVPPSHFAPPQPVPTPSRYTQGARQQIPENLGQEVVLTSPIDPPVHQKEHRSHRPQD